MSGNYPIFTFNNESVIVRPGREFSKNELNSRLHQMGFQMNEIKDKNTMAGIYDSYLQNDQNKLKIFNILRKDTQMRNSRLGISQRESVTPSNTMSNNSKSKFMNISNEVRPFESGYRREQEISLSKNNYTNRPEYTPNSFVSNNMNHERDNETVDYRHQNNMNQKSIEQSFNNSRNFQNQNLNASRRSEFGNYQNLNNSKNNYNNNNSSNNTNYQNFNNESTIRVRENINNSINEKSYTNKGTPSYNPSQEFNSSNLRNSKSNPYRNNNNNYYNNNINYNNNNYNNYSNNNNYNNNSGNMNQNTQRMNIEPNNQPAGSYREEIPSGRNNDFNQRREPDEESEFSIFSTFRKLKNTPLYKNRKHICVNIVLSLLIVCLAIGLFKLVNSYWDSITDYFSELANRGFVEAVTGFISSIFFGSIRYYYITIPLVIFIFLIVLFLKEYIFKKRCEEILNNMVNDLRNGTTTTGNRYLTNNDIFRDYAKKYGISKEEFEKKYLKRLNRMKRDISGMKQSSQIDNNGNEIILWEYDN